MSFFIWKESFNTGIPVIDRQHQKIFTVLNKLYDATQSPVDNTYVKRSLHEMNEYALLHFSTEEKLMAQYEYHELETQKNQHKYYEEQVARLSRAYDEKNVSDCKNLLQFLKDWFLGHILQEDLKFSKAVASKLANS